MHEMLKEEGTEAMLVENCKKVGDHLYIKPESDVSGNGKEDFVIVLPMGGSGSRLKHITKDEYSKHLIEVRGKPISRYVFDMWVKSGFTDVCILTDDTHRGKSVTEYYKDGKQFGADVTYSIEHMKLGSAGALKQAIDSNVLTKSFINHYPDDIIMNYPNFAKDFAKVCSGAIKAGYDCIILCVPGKLYPYGVVEDKEGRVVDYIEKPFISKDTSTGIYGVSKSVFPVIQELEENTEYKLERSVFNKVAKNGKILKVLIPTEYWVPINDEINLNKFIELTK
jgi:NDP-sugar pyrophosphorylase family protein